jgi:hypothetical protein
MLQLPNSWFKSALWLFLIAAIYGLLLRYMQWQDIDGVNYKFLLHGHSHLAQLGWGFLLTSGSLLLFAKLSPGKEIWYRIIYWIIISTSAGMAATFPIQGYAGLSIAFSSIHVVGCYLFAYRFLKDITTKGNPFLKWGVIWMVVSTLGIWSIPIVTITLGKTHALYSLAVQFFLHMQFNGWFTYATIGVLIQYLRSQNSQISIPKTAFWLFQAALILTYFISISWNTISVAPDVLLPIGSVFQLLAITIMIGKFHPAIKRSFTKTTWHNWLIYIGLIGICIKVIIQLTLAIPNVMTVTYGVRPLLIGFIHLIMLGSVTMSLVGLLLKQKSLPSNPVSKTGWIIFVTAFLLTEGLLFSQGIGRAFQLFRWPNFAKWMFLVSCLLPLGILVVLGGFIKPKNKSN